MAMIEQTADCAEITNAFAWLGEQNIDLMPATYQRFFQLCPQAEALMGHSDAPMRGRMLDQTYELLMDAELGGPESYFRWEIHNHLSAYGVTAAMYKIYFQALGDAFTAAMGDAWREPIASAWQRRLAHLLADVRDAQSA